MSKRTLIPLAAMALVCGGTVAVAHAATSQGGGGSTRATCTARPNVTDVGTAQQITVVCTVPKPPTVTVTSSGEATATATVTATTTATAPPTATTAPTDLPTDLPTALPPTQSTTPTLTSSPTPTAPPTPTNSPTGSPGCASAAANVPDGSDGRGGCFPGPSNTGPNAAASSMATYTGSCTIDAANTVIDSKVVNCRSIDVRAAGFVLKNSYLNGGIVQSRGTSSFTVQDSFIDSGVQFPACGNGSCPAGKYACGDTRNATTDCGVTGSNFTIERTEIINSNRAAYCESSCLIQNNYFHGTNLWPDASNLAHASSVREEQNLTLRHNSLHCSYNGPFVNGDIGCSADLTGYPDFAPIKNNTVDRNLFVANPGNAYCAYGGDTTGKPFSSDPTNATYQTFTNNVFQRGTNKKCGSYGAVTSFDSSGVGNVWSGNVWDDGTPVQAAR